MAVQLREHEEVVEEYAEDLGGPVVRIVGKDPSELPPDDGTIWEVVAPNPEYAGITCGIRFQNGSAIVRNADLARRFEHDFGYRVRQRKRLRKGE